MKRNYPIDSGMYLLVQAENVYIMNKKGGPGGLTLDGKPINTCFKLDQINFVIDALQELKYDLLEKL
jgi:hypothetical protein